MNRRRFLELTVGSSAIFAGCSESDPGTPTESTATEVTTPTRSSTPTTQPTETGTETQTETSEAHPDTIFVGPDGSPSNPGTADAPLDSISDAVSQVKPGQAVEVRPGEYREHVPFNEGGRPGEPITLTGPPEAVLKPGEHQPIAIRASHVHITGLTIDGLIDEANPDDPDAYNEHQLIGISPMDPDPRYPQYIEDLVISPHRMGNSQSAFINAALLKDSEIGGFEVIGPAGTEWILGDTHGHNGEFVYLGTAPNNLQRNQGIEVYDQTRNIHVHHIDNSAGYAHSELVDCKIGTQNITIEYCTDGGGVQSQDSYYSRSISLDGHGCTIRWNVFQNAMGSGIRVGPQDFLHDDAEYSVDEGPQTEFERQMGKDHAIYGNVFTGNTTEAIDFLRESRRPGRESNPLPDDQRVFCGNLFDAYTDGDPGKPCDADLPTGDGVGHQGGDSPWDGVAPSKTAVYEQHAQDPQLNVTVDKDTVPTNTEFEIPVTVANTGDATEDVEIVLRVREHELERETVGVPADEEREVILRHRLSVAGEMAVTRNGQKIGSVYVTDDD